MTTRGTWIEIAGVRVVICRKTGRQWRVNVGGIEVFRTNDRHTAGRVFTAIVAVLRQALVGVRASSL